MVNSVCVRYVKNSKNIYIFVTSNSLSFLLASFLSNTLQLLNLVGVLIFAHALKSVLPSLNVTDNCIVNVFIIDEWHLILYSRIAFI